MTDENNIELNEEPQVEPEPKINEESVEEPNQVKVEKKREKKAKQNVSPIEIPSPQALSEAPKTPKKANFFKRLFSRKEKTYKPHPLIEAPIPKKKVTEYADLQFADIKKCPQCNSKLQKSKVYQQEEKVVQYFKCKNIICDFYKKIELR